VISVQSVSNSVNICPNGVVFVKEHVRKGILPRYDVTWSVSDVSMFNTQCFIKNSCSCEMMKLTELHVVNGELFSCLIPQFVPQAAIHIHVSILGSQIVADRRNVLSVISFYCYFFIFSGSINE